MALYTLPKRYHPDFSLPNKKPIGPVVVDRSSDFGPNVQYHFLGDEVADKQVQNTSTRTITSSGKAAEFSASSLDRISWGSSFDLFRQQEFTIFLRFTLPTPSSNSIYIANQDVRWNVAVGNEGLSGLGFVWYDGTAFRIIDFGVPTSANAQTMVISKQQGVSTTAYLYVDGTKTKISDTVNLVDIQYETARTGTLGARTFEETNNNQELLIHEFYFLNKALPESQVDSLEQDRYQIFNPATLPEYFTASAPVAGGNLLLTNRSIANFQGMRQ